VPRRAGAAIRKSARNRHIVSGARLRAKMESARLLSSIRRQQLLPGQKRAKWSTRDKVHKIRISSATGRDPALSNVGLSARVRGLYRSIDILSVYRRGGSAALKYRHAHLALLRRCLVIGHV